MPGGGPYIIMGSGLGSTPMNMSKTCCTIGRRFGKLKPTHTHALCQSKSGRSDGADCRVRTNDERRRHGEPVDGVVERGHEAVPEGVESAEELRDAVTHIDCFI